MITLDAKIDNLIIAARHSGAREMSELLNQYFEVTGKKSQVLDSTITLEVYKHSETTQRLIGILEIESLEQLMELNMFTILKENGTVHLFLRNPLLKIYDTYLERRKKGEEELSFFNAIKWDGYFPEYGLGSASTGYIKSGQYFKGTSNLLEQLNHTNLEIIQFEDLIKNPIAVLSKIKTNTNASFRIPAEEVEQELKKKLLASKRGAILNGWRKRPQEFNKEIAAYIYFTYFKRDIEAIEQLLDINLAAWKFIGHKSPVSVVFD